MGVSGFTVHGIQQHVRMLMIRMYPRSETKNGCTNSEGRADDAIVNQEQQRKSVHLRRSTATARNGQSAPQLALQYRVYRDEDWNCRHAGIYK